jgi:hypothetical protein
VSEAARDPDRARLERIAIRTRESGVTLAAWRLGISPDRGAGAITLVEIGSSSVYRGDGAFLGWSQARLEAEYRRLLPQGSGPEPDPGQFG